MTFKLNTVASEFYLEVEPARLDLMVNDSAGTPWFVVGLTADGRLVRYSSLPEDLGLKLNRFGKVKIDRNRD